MEELMSLHLNISSLRENLRRITISANSRLTFPSKVVAIQKGRDTPVKSSYVTGSHTFIES